MRYKKVKTHNPKLAQTFNANTNAAIYWCEANPEEWQSLLNEAVTKTLNQLEQILTGKEVEKTNPAYPASHELADTLAEKGIIMYPQLIEMLICKKLEAVLDLEVETTAGLLLADGFTKKNLAFFMDTSPSNLNVRYPHLNDIAAAQDEADATNQTQVVDMGNGITREVFPNPRQ